MLPNEIIDKIFQYRYQNFKKFLSKIKKVNREYHQKFILDCRGYLTYIFDGIEKRDFIYNFRDLRGSRKYIIIHNPKPTCMPVAELCKNYQ